MTCRLPSFTGIDIPGLTFIDDEGLEHEQGKDTPEQNDGILENVEKATTADDNNRSNSSIIEQEPTSKQKNCVKLTNNNRFQELQKQKFKDELLPFKKTFKRDLNSPTKSLQLEPGSKEQIVEERRSSLSVLALTAAAQVRTLNSIVSRRLFSSCPKANKTYKS